MRAFIALAAGVFFISWSAIFITWAQLPGSASAFYRVLFAAVALSPWLLRNRSLLTRKVVLMASAAGIFFAADLGLYSSAILQSTATNATVLGNITPVFVGLLTWMFLGRRPHPAFWLGLVVATCGSLVIVGGDLLHRAGFGPADLLAVGSAACFGVYLLATERVRISLDAATLLALSLAVSAVALLLFNLGAGVSFRVPDAHAWLALLGLAVVCQLAGYFALTYALGHLSASVTSVTLLVQVPLTAWLALIFLGEPVSASQAAGGALVLLGVWIVNYYSRQADVPYSDISAFAAANCSTANDKSSSV